MVVGSRKAPLMSRADLERQHSGKPQASPSSRAPIVMRHNSVVMSAAASKYAHANLQAVSHLQPKCAFRVGRDAFETLVRRSWSFLSLSLLAR